MRLPSGREQAYPFPRLHTNARGDLTVVYKDNAAGKWVDCKHHGQLGSWPGGWTENAVQAVARDLFAAAMQRLDAAGYPIVLHVHDEVVAEVPIWTGSKDDFQAIITALPDWATGLPVAAKGDERERFCKIAPAEIPKSEPREAHGLDADEPAETANTYGAPPDIDEDTCEADDTCGDGDNTSDDTMRGGDDGYSSNAKRPRGRSQVFYIYQDEKGEPYGRVTRTTTKRFFQSRWENGKWVFKAPKPRIPYRLPELLAAPLSEPVFICEGEKDAINVAALGLIATTNPGGGIARAWTHDLNQWFAERTVYICEDNDATGHTHVNEVARALKSVATEIRIVEFRDIRKAVTSLIGSLKADIAPKTCSSAPWPGAFRTKAIRSFVPSM